MQYMSFFVPAKGSSSMNKVYNSQYPGSGCIGCGSVYNSQYPGSAGLGADTLYLPTINDPALTQHVISNAIVQKSAEQQKQDLLIYGAGALLAGVAVFFVVKKMKK